MKCQILFSQIKKKEEEEKKTLELVQRMIKVKVSVRK